MGVAIRSARAGDGARLVELIGQLGYIVNEAEVAERLAGMEVNGRLVLVAELDGGIVGCLSTSFTHVLHRRAPLGRISMMIVDETLRGRGIGAALVRAAEEALAECGCATIEVTSNLRRTQAHRFYEKFGYELTSVRLVKSL